MRRSIRTLCLSALAAGAAPFIFFSPTSAATYVLTPSEYKLNCKRLAGRMQVRILQIRDFSHREQTSALARGIQSAVTPIYGGTTAGSDPNGQYARDIAILEAFNARLAELKCKTFDLPRWLNSTDPKDLPHPTIAPHQ